MGTESTEIRVSYGPGRRLAFVCFCVCHGIGETLFTLSNHLPAFLLIRTDLFKGLGEAATRWLDRGWDFGIECLVKQHGGKIPKGMFLTSRRLTDRAVIKFGELTA